MVGEGSVDFRVLRIELEGAFEGGDRLFEGARFEIEEGLAPEGAEQCLAGQGEARQHRLKILRPAGVLRRQEQGLAAQASTRLRVSITKTYGLGAETSDLPAFVVMSTGAGISGGAANWSSGFLPTVYSGVRFRNQGDPILNVSSPAGI